MSQPISVSNLVKFSTIWLINELSNP